MPIAHCHINIRIVRISWKSWKCWYVCMYVCDQTSTICTIHKIIRQTHLVKCLFGRHFWINWIVFDFYPKTGPFHTWLACRRIFRLWRNIWIVARMLEEPHWRNEEPNILLIKQSNIEMLEMIIIKAASMRLPKFSCLLPMKVKLWA